VLTGHEHVQLVFVTCRSYALQMRYQSLWNRSKPGLRVGEFLAHHQPHQDASDVVPAPALPGNLMVKGPHT
jgi:hypothetical protein